MNYCLVSQVDYNLLKDLKADQFIIVGKLTDELAF